MHGQRRRMFVWQLLFACCMLRVVGFMPSVVYCGVHGMCCILHAARCVSYDACCMLIVARCTRHAGDCNTEPLASMGHARTARLLRLLDRRGRAWHAAVPYPFPSLHARAHSRSHARTSARARALSRTRSARSCACTSGGRVGELLSRTLPAIARLALALPSVRRHEQWTLAVPPCSMHVSCSMQRAPCIHPACTVRHSSDLPAGTHAQRTPLRSRCIASRCGCVAHPSQVCDEPIAILRQGEAASRRLTQQQVAGRTPRDTWRAAHPLTRGEPCTPLTRGGPRDAPRVGATQRTPVHNAAWCNARTHGARGAARACVMSASDRTGCIAARECILLHVPAAQPPVGERRSPVDQFLDAVRAARRLRDAELLSAAGASHRVVGCTWHAVSRLWRRGARCGLPGASAVYAAVLLCGLLRDGAGGQAALHLQLLRSRRNARRAWCATCSMRRCDSAKCNVQDAYIVSATMQTLSVSTCLRLHSPLPTGEPHERVRRVTLCANT
jgi:hypothetical protein